MSVSTDTSLLARAFDWIKARLARDNELATLSHADLLMLADDIGVTEADLRYVVPETGDHSELMDQMMIARGLDPAAVRAALGPLVHDMAITCARCGDVGRCRAELRAGTAAESCPEYCGNAALMSELLAAKRS